MPQAETRPSGSKAVMSNCPECSAELAVLRIIPGKAGCEYWTMRCTKCGGIHLDIVKADSPGSAIADPNNIFA